MLKEMFLSGAAHEKRSDIMAQKMDAAAGGAAVGPTRLV
jgi:hypothetical protein